MGRQRAATWAAFGRSLGIYVGITAAVIVLGVLGTRIFAWPDSVVPTMLVTGGIGTVIFCAIYFVIHTLATRRRAE